MAKMTSDYSQREPDVLRARRLGNEFRETKDHQSVALLAIGLHSGVNPILTVSEGFPVEI
jgi:hypothetical protein